MLSVTSPLSRLPCDAKSFCGTNQYCSLRAWVETGSGWGWWVLSISCGAPWIRDEREFGLLITCVLLCALLFLLRPSREKKKHVKAVPFHLHQNQFCLLPIASRMQAKQWQRNYKQGNFFIAFLFASTLLCCFVWLNANRSWRCNVGRKGGLGFADI